MQVVHGDIRDVDYPPADAVVILDVLHYLDYTAQERVLRRVRAALLPHGLLLLRIGDATGGAGFALGKALDRTVVLLRRRRWQRLHCRALGDWQALLSALRLSRLRAADAATARPSRTYCCAPRSRDTARAQRASPRPAPSGAACRRRSPPCVPGAAGSAPCAFETVTLDTCVGEVAGVDASALPPALDAEFDCRNNRLAWLGLNQDGFAEAVERAAGRYGRARLGIFLGTSTSGILETELAYRRRDPAAAPFRRTSATRALTTASRSPRSCGARCGSPDPRW